MRLLLLENISCYYLGVTLEMLLLFVLSETSEMLPREVYPWWGREAHLFLQVTYAEPLTQETERFAKNQDQCRKALST